MAHKPKTRRRRRRIGRRVAGRPSNRNHAIAQVLEQALEPIMALERPVLDKMAPILAQAQAELERNLRLWLAKQDGMSRFTTQKHRNALVQVRGVMEGLKSLEPAAMEGFRIGSRHAGILATEQLEFQLQQFAAIFRDSVRPIGIDPAIVLAKQESLVLSRFAGSARRYHTHVRETLVKELAVSRLVGESMHELATRLQEKLPIRWTQVRSNAERLARTETMNAYNTYHHQALREAHGEDEEILMRWDASFDRRRCIQCANLEGTIVAVDDEFAAEWESGGRTFSSSHRHPPAHPNCRCVLVPWKSHWPETDFDAPPPRDVGAGTTMSAGA